jgi:hypothetical protein
MTDEVPQPDTCMLCSSITNQVTKQVSRSYHLHAPTHLQQHD